MILVRYVGTSWRQVIATVNGDGGRLPGVLGDIPESPLEQAPLVNAAGADLLPGRQRPAAAPAAGLIRRGAPALPPFCSSRSPPWSWLISRQTEATKASACSSSVRENRRASTKRASPAPRLDAQRAVAVVGADLDLLDLAQVKGKLAAWMALIQDDQPAVRQHHAGTRGEKAVERQVAAKVSTTPSLSCRATPYHNPSGWCGLPCRVPPLLDGTVVPLSLGTALAIARKRPHCRKGKRGLITEKIRAEGSKEKC